MTDLDSCARPCSHPGCFNHVSHPCEGCGRIGGEKAYKCLCTNPNCLEEFWAKASDEIVTDKYGSEFCSQECFEEYEEMDW